MKLLRFGFYFPCVFRIFYYFINRVCFPDLFCQLDQRQRKCHFDNTRFWGEGTFFGFKLSFHMKIIVHIDLFKFIEHIFLKYFFYESKESLVDISPSPGSTHGPMNFPQFAVYTAFLERNISGPTFRKIILVIKVFTHFKQTNTRWSGAIAIITAVSCFLPPRSTTINLVPVSATSRNDAPPSSVWRVCCSCWQ